MATKKATTKNRVGRKSPAPASIVRKNNATRADLVREATKLAIEIHRDALRELERY